MMHTFLADNRDELVERCKVKVAKRPQRDASDEQLKNGVPLFLEQLRRTLEAEEADDHAKSLKISGASGGDIERLSEVGVSAAAHGKQLLGLGYSINQVVHDYGDLCQAVTELAIEHDVPFAVTEFRTLNRCLDNAIADAVTEFSDHRDIHKLGAQHVEEDERFALLAREHVALLSTAMLALNAIEGGSLSMRGATGAILRSSLVRLQESMEGDSAAARRASTVHESNAGTDAAGRA